MSEMRDDAARLAEIDMHLAQHSAPAQRHPDWRTTYEWTSHEVLFLRHLLDEARAEIERNGADSTEALEDFLRGVDTTPTPELRRTYRAYLDSQKRAAAVEGALTRAHREGAEAMREAAAQVANNVYERETVIGRTHTEVHLNTASCIRDSIRALPLPGDKP